jgi:DNA-binding PadR family transcriptional regulator
MASPFNIELLRAVQASEFPYQGVGDALSDLERRNLIHRTSFATPGLQIRAGYRLTSAGQCVLTANPVSPHA